MLSWVIFMARWHKVLLLQLQYLVEYLVYFDDTLWFSCDLLVSVLHEIRIRKIGHIILPLLHTAETLMCAWYSLLWSGFSRLISKLFLVRRPYVSHQLHNIATNQQSDLLFDGLGLGPSSRTVWPSNYFLHARGKTFAVQRYSAATSGVRLSYLSNITPWCLFVSNGSHWRCCVP